ncbi:MAG: lactate utilization protein, partial [Oscillospiraceae bacterium]|nr:lactate utilization protein [Oscillospiraceae bacterium]
MNTNLDAVITQKLERTAKALEKNNMKAYICENKEEALSVVKSLLTKGETLSTGGSVSLQECGVIDLLKSGDYNYLDRTGLSGEAIEKLYRDCFSADSYLCSSNAVTEDGYLYNVDGNSNRVSAITFGPRQVIMVVGINKVVRNIDEAAKR